MANIRFVAPPNDNKIRQFPRVHDQNDVLHIATPFSNDVIHITTPQPSDVLHITTPKRKNSHIPKWDLFITSTGGSSNKPASFSLQHARNDAIETDTDISEQTRNSFNKRPSDSPENTESKTNKKSKDLNQNSLPLSDNVANFTTFKKIDQNENEFLSINRTKKVPSDNDAKELKMERKTVNRDSEGEMVKHSGLMQDTNQTILEINSTKCPVMKFYSSFYGDVTGHLTDVSDEELDSLPEIQSPGGVLKMSPTSPRQQQQPSHAHQQQQQQQPQLPAMFQNEKPARHRPVRRSISEAALMDNKTESFFSSINDAKYYNIDSDQCFDIRDMAIDLDEMINGSKTNGFRRLNEPVRNAWGNAVQKTELSGSENCLDKPKGKKKLSLSKTTVGKIELDNKDLLKSRSESCDSLTSDRLRMRRCALAQPERMIISQEIRERIEKDVEKRKCSMVRKVSQFLNVQLGLNKEEDLI